MAEISFWYEFASTYSYPAAMRLDLLAEAAGVKVRWRPFLLGPLFAELGWTTSPFNLQPAKGAYMWRDLARICARDGLVFRHPDPFPQHSVMAARIASALPDDGSRAAFSRGVYLAEFGDGADISQPEHLSAALARLGDDGEAVMARATEPANKVVLREAVEEAKALGVFGAPSFVTGDGELFWGNDRLEEALAWAASPPAL